MTIQTTSKTNKQLNTTKFSLGDLLSHRFISSKSLASVVIERDIILPNQNGS